jgi:hypothetical protein
MKSACSCSNHSNWKRILEHNFVLLPGMSATMLQLHIANLEGKTPNVCEELLLR